MFCEPRSPWVELGDHDRPAAGGLEVLDGRPGGVEHPGEVDADHVGPGLVAHLLGAGIAGDPGVGADDVEATELGDALVDGGAQRGTVTHVDLCGDHSAVECLDLASGLREILGRGERIGHRAHRRAHVDGDDVGTLARQPQCMAAPLSTCGAGDQGHRALELSHDRCPPGSCAGTGWAPAGLTTARLAAACGGYRSAGVAPRLLSRRRRRGRSLVHRTGVDGQLHPGDVATGVADQEEDGVGDVDGLHPGDRQALRPVNCSLTSALVIVSGSRSGRKFP